MSAHLHTIFLVVLSFSAYAARVHKVESHVARAKTSPFALRFVPTAAKPLSPCLYIYHATSKTADPVEEKVPDSGTWTFPMEEDLPLYLSVISYGDDADCQGEQQSFNCMKAEGAEPCSMEPSTEESTWFYIRQAGEYRMNTFTDEVAIQMSQASPTDQDNVLSGGLTIQVPEAAAAFFKTSEMVKTALQDAIAAFIPGDVNSDMVQIFFVQDAPDDATALVVKYEVTLTEDSSSTVASVQAAMTGTDLEDCANFESPDSPECEEALSQAERAAMGYLSTILNKKLSGLPLASISSVRATK